MYDVYLLITPGDVTQITYSLIKKCTCNNIAKVNNGYVSSELGLRISISEISPWISFWELPLVTVKQTKQDSKNELHVDQLFLKYLQKRQKLLILQIIYAKEKYGEYYQCNQYYIKFHSNSISRFLAPCSI